MADKLKINEFTVEYEYEFLQISHWMIEWEEKKMVQEKQE